MIFDFSYLIDKELVEQQNHTTYFRDSILVLNQYAGYCESLFCCNRDINVISLPT